MKRIALYFILSFAPLFILSGSAQSYRDYIRRGNRQYRDSVYEKAQVQYQKGYEKDSGSVEINYNLANSLLMQGQPKEAMRLYEKVSRVEHDKGRRHQIYHNMGVILQSQKQFAPAIEAYKEALRCDPQDDETRYNLVLCQRQLKENPNQDKKDGDKDENKEKQKDDKKQQQQQEKEKQQQQQQQQQPQPNEMSRENAEQMLNAAMQNERQTQDKVKKQLEARPRRLQKQW